MSLALISTIPLSGPTTKKAGLWQASLWEFIWFSQVGLDLSCSRGR